MRSLPLGPPKSIFITYARPNWKREQHIHPNLHIVNWNGETGSNSKYDLDVGARQVGTAFSEQSKPLSDLPRPYQAYPNLELLETGVQGLLGCVATP
ncbi:MAG: hypothetical protein HYR94_28430 [Chloroflexi bacterium]|nr:hypothetical protein [Chloroflexota bacterium]